MFEAPSVMLSPYVSRMRLIVSSVTSDSLRVCSHRHRERIDHDVLERDLVPAVHDVDEPSADVESFVGRLWNARLVVDEADDRGAVLLHQRQHSIEAIPLARDRVHECLALVGGQPGFQSLDDRGVDTDRKVGVLLHQRDGAGEQVCLVRQGNAHVDVEDVRASRHLILDVRQDLREVTFAQGRRRMPSVPSG